MWLCGWHIAFGVPGESFFHIYCTTDIVFAIIKFEDIDIIPHSLKIQRFVKKQKADSVRRSLLNRITSVGHKHYP
jgi:hypothetical protein